MEVKLIALTRPNITAGVSFAPVYEEDIPPSYTGYVAAKECYSADKIASYMDYDVYERQDIDGLLKKVLGIGHMSVIEHCSVSFEVSGVSRILTHQLVRHRLASYSQRSQRYVSEADCQCVVPPAVKLKPEIYERWIDIKSKIDALYEDAIEAGIKKEDARYFLPHSAQTNIVMTMNYRSLINFLEHRCCQRAQWEIRQVAQNILDIMTEIDPIIFGEDGVCNGPACERLKYCPEGKMSCGKYSSVKTILGTYKKK